MKENSKIIRTWKGWTSLENASVYEKMLVEEVFPTVKKNGVKGLSNVNISKRIINNEVEFFLVLKFESLTDVKQFAGENYEKAYIPDNAKQVLSRFDKTAQHFEFIEELVL